MDKLTESLIGTFLGFFLGLITLAIKEKLDTNRRAEQFRVTALHYLRSLKAYLHEDPVQCRDLSLRQVSELLDGTSSSNAYRVIYEKMFDLHMDWARGCYLPSGIKYNEMELALKGIDNLIQDLSIQ